jgi:hypothetical protein
VRKRANSNRRSVKVRLWSVLGAMVLAAAGLALSAGSASASGGSCGSQLLTYWECTGVNGHGLYVDSVLGYLSGSPSEPILNNIHIEIYGPRGHIANCGTFNLDGQSPTCQWNNPHPRTPMPGGDYCTRAWQEVSPHKYVQLRAECVNVHR